MSLERWAKLQLALRKRRLRSPHFKAEMLHEKHELDTIKKRLRKETLIFLYEGLLKRMILGGLKIPFKLGTSKRKGLGKPKTHGFSGAASDFKKESSETGHMAFDTMKEVIRVGAKKSKIAIRHLIAK